MLSAVAALEDHGWTVKKAAKGTVAMERFPAMSDDVDVIVVDWRLGKGRAARSKANDRLMDRSRH